MVDVFTISRLGGAYTSVVFGEKTDPSVTLKITKWKWTFKDMELAIDIPETTMVSPPKTIAGGFKRITIIIAVEGYIDRDPDTEGDVPSKIAMLWNIAEFGDSSNTFATYRGADLFGITKTLGAGELKITQLEITEDSIISEPAQNIHEPYSMAKRARFTMQLRKMKKSG